MFGAKRFSRTAIRIRLSHDAQHRADLLTSRRSAGIDAALDLRDAVRVAVNHSNDGDRAAYNDGGDWHQQRAQAENRVD
jgi:hypothetical protein